MEKAVAIPAVVGLMTLGVTPSTLAFAEPSEQGREPGRPPEVIRLVERVHDVALEDGGTPEPSLGDRLIFSADIFDEQGQLVGRDGADCVVVRTSRWHLRANSRSSSAWCRSSFPTVSSPSRVWRRVLTTPSR